jgi:hypothetical protein
MNPHETARFAVEILIDIIYHITKLALGLER